MNSYYILILTNSVGLFLSINQFARQPLTLAQSIKVGSAMAQFDLVESAMTDIGSKISFNTIENNKTTNIATCNATSKKHISSIIEQKTRLNVEKRSPANHKHNNSELPQASIWWAAEQFDPFGGSLIQNWLTYPQKQQINLTVNWQLWTTLDYLGRYRFVNQFGTVVRKHGYSLNVFSQKEQCLATYKYNSASKPPKWELHLEKLGRDSLEVESSQKMSR